MNTTLQALKTAADVKKAFACHANLIHYGAFLIATKGTWNYDTNRLDYTAALFDILTDTGKTATTTVMIAAESDKTFLDAGHAIEWAIAMIHAR
ncbi:VCBS domain-containing protein [Schaalia hyovaginalis]|uniref:VCBS repeat-containing protein n=1 Tax=Schaalia hyovaginalis TaxID=29316 RepID=A0A923IY43_9ACTO|nr:VCBS domain-containing protein [Schaalia hyovaginalis]MBB6335662.1 VCBS repeat-containing protein [Schaalia hyovaginalis]